MKRATKLILGAGILAGAAVVLAKRRRRQQEPEWTWEAPSDETLPRERRAEPDPEAFAAVFQGKVDRIGLNVERLKQLEEANYRPVVQYLTAIQVKRGEGGDTLLFVRQKDLDALAELAGDSKDSLVENFRQLGILMSMN